jgi:Flp pilus assembly protein TadG
MRHIPERNCQNGIIILLVAVVLLFVVGAMAALSIDVATFYTARSEAQLVADAAALAGARVLANSGFTSTSAIPSAAAEALATNVANQVAASSNVAGRTLNLSEITVSYPNVGNAAAFGTNPHITVAVKRTDVPTFFARIWGRTAVTVQASATAEAYNPSGVNALGLGVPVVPVAPTCVKPIVLPNLSPGGVSQIIDPTTGQILDTTLVGRDLSGTPLTNLCGSPGRCGNPAQWPWGSPTAWNYYSATSASFPPPPANLLPACAAGFNAYQESIAGCVQTPIACGATVNLEQSHSGNLKNDTDDAVNCLTHAPSGTPLEADSIDDLAWGPLNGQPFQFLAGTQNPLVLAGTISAGTDVLVSDSIATLPIFDSSVPLNTPPTPITIIGFVQLLLNASGSQTSLGSGQTITRVINIAGCGTSVAPQPILGNGASPVPVRLITPP